MDNIHPTMREFLAPFAPRPAINRQVEGVSEERYVSASLPAPANEGDFTREDLAAIDAQFGIRPELVKWQAQIDSSREKMRDEYDSGLDSVMSARQDRARDRRERIGGND